MTVPRIKNARPNIQNQREDIAQNLGAGIEIGHQKVINHRGEVQEIEIGVDIDRKNQNLFPRIEARERADLLPEKSLRVGRVAYSRTLNRLVYFPKVISDVCFDPNIIFAEVFT